MGGAWVEVGAFIIDRIDRKPGPDGLVWLTASGDDEIRELAGRSVGWLELASASAGITHAAALTAIGAAVATGWTLVPAASATNNYVYARFAGESVLAALVGVAQKTQTHFYRSGPRALTFASAFTSSGVRAIQASGDLVTETAAIVDLSEQIDTFDLLTRIVPLGAGNGEARLTLAASSRTAPSGYTVNKPLNYLQHNASVTTFGVIDAPWIEFKDVRPISNTDADLQAAADMLFDQALKELTRRAIDMQVATYAVNLAGCSRLLRPLQSLRLVYRDIDSGINIDQDVNILAATWEISADAIQTTAVELSTSDLWPQDDVGAVVERMNEGTVYQAHPQLNANAYVIAYTKHLDETQANPAQFRFRFDQEVTQLTRVCFDFQLLPLESTVKTIALEQETGGEISTSFSGNSGASGAASTGSPSNNNSGTAAGNTGTPSNNNSGTAAGNTGTPSNNNSGTAAGNTGTAAGSTSGPSPDLSSSATGNTGVPDTPTTLTPFPTASTGPNNNTSGTASGNTGGPSEDDTLGSGDLTTDGPQGGDTVGGGRHVHGTDVGIIASPDYANVVYFQDDGDDSHLYARNTASGFQVGGRAMGTVSGDHTHPLNDHTHNLNSHAHNLAGHTHDLNSHTHTLNDHTHDLNNHAHGIGHAHDLGAHTHTLGSHTHGLNSHTHDLNLHFHTLGSHTHDLNLHFHTMGNHTHDLNDHTHTIAHVHTINHTHTFTAAIDTLYGVFRDTAGNTFSLGDLEYSLDGSTWYFFIPGVNGYASLGGGWNRVDLTGLVQNPVNFRPVASNNLLQIRRKLTGTAGKKATIDAQMSVRSVIQSIAFV